MKYTPDEIAALLANRPNQPHYVKALITKCVKAAVLAEREACATIDVTPINILASDGPGTAILKYIAAIRARGNP